MKPLSSCRVLLVDDTKTNIDVLVRTLGGRYRLGVAMGGAQAVEYAAAHRPDLILLDVLMPGMDGFEVCRRLKQERSTREIPIIFITAMDGGGDKSRAFRAGAVDYIVKPFDPGEIRARVRTHLSLKVAREAVRKADAGPAPGPEPRIREPEETRREILERFGRAAEHRDGHMGDHIRRLRRYSRLLGEAAGLPKEERTRLSLAGTLHDLGKIAVPDRILQKPSRLTASEFEVMKTHTHVGAELLAGSRSPLLRAAETIARTHHERWDGKGYPLGLRGEEIPLFGRIICICDVFDALVSERPYKKRWPVESALDEIRRESGRRFDPMLAAVFTDLRPHLGKIIDNPN